MTQETSKEMNYLRQVGTWLDEMGVRDEKVQRAIKEKILESYRNGKKEIVQRFTAVLKEVTAAPKKQYSKPRTNSKKYDRRD